MLQLRHDQNQKSRFENTRTGYRVVVPISAGTGERGEYVVVDDPHSVDQAESDTERRSVIEWWNGSMATRLNDFATGHKIVIMQRLHEADLTGDLLAKGGYDLLCLPEEFDPERRCITSIGWSDPRQQSGELLWPDKVSQADLERLLFFWLTVRRNGFGGNGPIPRESGSLKVVRAARRLAQYASLPDGTRKWIVRIPDWDLNWQGVYRLKEPLHLPRGTVVSMRYGGSFLQHFAFDGFFLNLVEEELVGLGMGGAAPGFHIVAFRLLRP